ncbi:NRAMP family divalent metal transporter [Salinarimonas soli]|uniref:Divalent metal cation transporter n=1 Tax=Salinarimonas soli TaxID=1638099 RepID=A0A5B2V7E5_9HYPH|nr:divalent metal cation transporter [Salinarimonas soli]KAA2234169.1 divalent metal cation transporter [Salinarimonas soli]
MDDAHQEPRPEPPSPVVEPSKPRLLKVLGPGFIAGASDDDPSGIGTYSQAGAQLGYALAWSMLFTFPLMTATQMVSARIGRTTGRGLAGILRQHYPGWLLHSIVLLVLTANIINIGADLGAMADATRLVIGGPQVLYVIAYAVICMAMQIFLQYTRYVSVLKWLALVLLAYVATLFMAKVSWRKALTGLVIPHLGFDKDQITTFVAILGTTISPYLFFWQAAQEAEDVRTMPRRRILKRAPEQGERALERIALDTVVGMAVSNLIAVAIILTCAATLHASGVTTIETSAQAAQALKPVAGALAEAIFAVGIVGTGLMAVPVLAGSAAYAIGEARKWPIGLSRQPTEPQAFYGTIVLATLIGMGLNLTALDPIEALYWSAVINGVVAVPVMAVMMWLSASQKVMGPFVVTGWLKALGWAATAVMAVAVVAMAIVVL